MKNKWKIEITVGQILTVKNEAELQKDDNIT